MNNKTGEAEMGEKISENDMNLLIQTVCKKNPYKGNFKNAFEQYLSETALNNGEYGVLLVTAKQMVFEREQQMLISGVFAGSSCNEIPNQLHRLRKQTTQ